MTDLQFRRAVMADLPDLIALLADDPLGATREQVADLPKYQRAFADLSRDDNQFLCVAEQGGRVVGCLQLSFITGLARAGARRGQIEGVRVSRSQRGNGIGQAMFDWAIAECRRRGCDLVQLTTDRSRPDAHRFYDRLGFVASHIGYKLHL